MILPRIKLVNVLHESVQDCNTDIATAKQSTQDPVDNLCNARDTFTYMDQL